MRVSRIFLVLICFMDAAVKYETARAEVEGGERIPVAEIPLVDFPFNATDGGWIVPSMRQSLGISTGFYQTFHHLIGRDESPDFTRRLMIAAFDLVTFYTPFGDAWLHEEWHRAVLGHRHISSFNDVYNLPIGSGLIAVSHVDDSELIRLKRDFPSDQVRLNSAGMEAQFEQNLLIERRKFFYGSRTWDQVVLWMNHLNSILYVNTCSGGPDADRTTQNENISDGSDVGKRDFTGLDCTAWAYDLFRPTEPYSARGTHPSGVGLNRYRKFSELNEEEKSFLRLQGALSVVNLVDPFLFYKDSFEGGPLGYGDRWNFNLRHFLTSFGYSLEANFFIKAAEKNWLIKTHAFANNARVFPGLTAELSRWPMPGTRLLLSPRASVWLQPENQSVRSTTDSAGALVALEAARPIARNADVFLGIEGKTPGWVAGNVYLERAVSFWSGLSYLF